MGDFDQFDMSVVISCNKPSIDKLVREISQSKYASFQFVVIWQTESTESVKNQKYPENIRIEVFHEWGLSRSRNRALEEVDSKYIWFSDDDIEYIQAINSKIFEQWRECKSADIMVFQVRTPEGKKYKDYHDKEYWHNHKTIFSVSSVEIIVKRNAILASGIKFDPRFGLGGRYPTGEEAVFLSDALRGGLRIRNIPFPICVHPKESSSNRYDTELSISRGALLFRIFGYFSYPLILLFVIKNRGRIQQDVGIIKSLRLMYAGANTFRRAV